MTAGNEVSERGVADVAGVDCLDEVLAAIFGASSAPMVMTDPNRDDNPIVAVNAAFCSMTGYSQEELVGRNCRMLQGRDTDLDEVARIRAAVAGRTGVRAKLQNYRKDGSSYWCSMVIDPVRDRHGQVSRFFATQLDVTRDHDLEESLTRAGAGHARSAEAKARDLQVALDQKTALLHEVDHRVKNNLQVISSLVLLKARRSPDGTRGALYSMAERIGALSTAHRMLYSVGDVSRFNLRDFITDLAADLSVSSDPERLRVEVEVEPIAVSASKAAPLALLVHELATNAARHAFPADRSGCVKIAAHRQAETVRLTVEDDGIGLSAGTPNPDGFGRMLVDMVVRQMRGEIVWEEALPGTRARIAIPLDAREIETA